MNKDIVEGQWKQLKGKVLDKLGDLTDDEMDMIKGDAQRLAGLVQERYGRTREQAEKEVNEFYDQHRK